MMNRRIIPMLHFHKLAGIVLWAAWMAPLGVAQEPPSPAAQPPGVSPQPAKPVAEMATREEPAVFKSRVNLVMVPVGLRDKQGRAVGNLKPEHFHLFDHGKPQAIPRS